MLNLNIFGPWAELGYAADLLLIIPPAAPLSPYSRLTPAHCGKTPGLPTPDGWTGFPEWPQHQTTLRELESWIKTLDGAPYNVGLNARHVHAIDVDTNDVEFARSVFHSLWNFNPVAMQRFGVRVGRAPGFLVPYIPEQPRRKQRLIFEKHSDGENFAVVPDSKAPKGAVELLGVGQQFVIGGRHPCGAEYLWHNVEGGMTFEGIMGALPPANWGQAN